MPSNLGPKAKIKKLKNAQRSARRAFRDFRASLQTPAVRRSLSRRFVRFVGI